MSQVATICQLMNLCVYVTQTLEKKNQVFTPGQLLSKSNQKKKEEIICPQHREKKKNSENN